MQRAWAKSATDVMSKIQKNFFNVQTQRAGVAEVKQLLKHELADGYTCELWRAYRTDECWHQTWNAEHRPLGVHVTEETCHPTSLFRATEWFAQTNTIFRYFTSEPIAHTDDRLAWDGYNKLRALTGKCDALQLSLVAYGTCWCI